MDSLYPNAFTYWEKKLSIIYALNFPIKKYLYLLYRNRQIFHWCYIAIMFVHFSLFHHFEANCPWLLHVTTASNVCIIFSWLLTYQLIGSLLKVYNAYLLLSIIIANHWKNFSCKNLKFNGSFWERLDTANIASMNYLLNSI